MSPVGTVELSSSSAHRDGHESTYEADYESHNTLLAYK